MNFVLVCFIRQYHRPSNFKYKTLTFHISGGLEINIKVSTSREEFKLDKPMGDCRKGKNTCKKEEKRTEFLIYQVLTHWIMAVIHS